MKRYLLFFIFFSSVLCAEDLEEKVKSANQLFSAGEFEKAKVKYLDCFAEKKDDSSLLYNLGNVEFKLARYKESLNYYQEALKLKPNEYLVRNLLYHMGNAQQAIAHLNMQEKAPDIKVWDTVSKTFDSIEISTTDKNQRLILKKMIDELKLNISKSDFVKAEKCLYDIDDISKKANDKIIMAAIENIKKEMGNDTENAKTKNIENQIEKVKQSIRSYEDSFQNYRKALEVSRKIAIKEGRDITEVGNYIKNNWAIGRERWSLLYEELNRLMKESLKLKEGVAELTKVQEELYHRLEEVYMNSQLQEILDYNLKVLAEFHADYKQDIVQLQKIADDELNTKKTELENLKNTQKQAQGNNPEQEKVSYEKQEKEIEIAEKISAGLRNVEGFENFIEDGLKRSDLFNVRRNAFQMLTFLKGLSDYLNKGGPVERTFSEIEDYLAKISQLIDEFKTREDVKPELKDTMGDNKFKSLKIIQEKLIDTEFLGEQLCLYLEDYIKEGSLQSNNDKKEETPESKWLMETLNLYVKSVVGKLVEEIKVSQGESKLIRENLVKNVISEEKFQSLKNKSNHQFETFKNALLGMVEGVQKGIDQLDSRKDNIDNINEISFYYETLENKLQFLLTELEKENAPANLKNSLIYIKQKFQHYQENYPIIFDTKKDKELRSSTIKVVMDDLSQIIFFIDPIKTLNFKFKNLVLTDAEIPKDQESSIKHMESAFMQISAIKSYFDILIDSINNQMNEPAKQDNSAKDLKNEDKNKKEILETILQDWKKSLSLLNIYEKSLKSLDLKLATAWEINTNLLKVFSSGLQQSAIRFQSQPQQATDTLKLAIGVQKIQKEISKEIVEKKWKEQLNNTSLDALKSFQQENIELVGVRGINQVLKMKEEAEKATSQAPQGPNPTPAETPDFDGAINFMKEAVLEGDKLVSFYEVREFSNTADIHDKKIEALTKALEILDKKGDKQDQNSDKNQENKDEQKEQQAEASPQEKNGEDQNKSEKSKEERKPLELTAEEARQLLNELNKNDEGEKKPAVKKKTINTPRPW